MDLTETIAPKSDQQNYDDYIGGIQRTVTISAVTKGNAEQPVNIELAEYPGRPFKPNKSMRRLLVVAWGADSSAYIGRRMTLFGNPEVVYGGKAVGGIEIAALSHLDKPLTVALTATRGRKRSFTVQPLMEPVKPTVDWDAELQAAGNDMSAIKAIYNRANQLGDTAALAKIKAAGDAILAANKEES
jgi:hypothetical protein